VMILAALQGSVPNWILDVSPRVLTHLIEPATRTLVIAAVAGLVTFIVGVKNLSLRLSIWKSVVCAALAMPILAACLPPLQVSVPVPGRIQRIFEGGVKAQVPSVDLAVHSVSTASRIAAASPAPVIARHMIPSNDASRPHDSYTPSARISRSSIELAIYAGGASFLAFRFLLGWYLSRKLRQASRVIHDIGVTARFRARCSAAQLRALPRFAESDRLAVPLTCGVVRPAVLLPADWRTWDVEKLDAVLTHEISHVARRDALSERLALLHRSIFWFSPLAWWLPRCVADLAEEASDEAALAAGAEPTKYAEILLGFLEDLNSASWRARWQGVAMAEAGSAEKRLNRILNGRTVMSMKQGKKSFVAILIFASVPVVLVAAALQPHRLGPQIVFNHYPSRPAIQAAATGQSETKVSPTPAAAPSSLPAPAVSAMPTVRAMPAPSAEEAPGVLVTPEHVILAMPAPRPTSTVVALAHVTAVSDPAPLALHVMVIPQVRAQATAPPAVPPVVAPVPPAPASPPGGYSFSYSTDGENAYAIISGKTQTMSGSFSHRDFAKLEALRNQLNSDFIWFERDGKSYIITDPATVSRAKQAFARQAELGEKEGELGEQLGKLGELQGQLGEQQGEIGEQMGKMYANLGNMDLQLPDMKIELEALQSQAQDISKAAAAQFDSEAFRSSMEKMQKDLAAAQKALEANLKITDAQVKAGVSATLDSSVTDAALAKARAAMDRQMSALAEQQAALDGKQATLSQQQEELGRQQAAESAKARAEVKSIIDQAISSGMAQPAPKQ
jgi:beta-lactamase regulating signal transducer with metallopeptidase domain